MALSSRLSANLFARFLRSASPLPPSHFGQRAGRLFVWLAAGELHHCSAAVAVPPLQCRPLAEAQSAFLLGPAPSQTKQAETKGKEETKRNETAKKRKLQSSDKRTTGE